MKSFLVGLMVLLGGMTVLSSCSQVVDALVNSDNPHSLSASRGDGTLIGLTWGAPSSKTVSFYTVYRNGISVGTTGSTGYSETPASWATAYTYYVTAQLTDGSTTGPSNTDIGWCVPAVHLNLGTSPGGQQASAWAGWYTTYVARGWTYHFRFVVGSGLLKIVNHDNPAETLASSVYQLDWTADRTGLIWVQTPTIPGSTLTGWY